LPDYRFINDIKKIFVATSPWGRTGAAPVLSPFLAARFIVEITCILRPEKLGASTEPEMATKTNLQKL